MTSITVSVVAHRDRTVMAEKLAFNTYANTVNYDDGTLGACENHRRTWQQLALEHSDWSVVLEDDAVPVPCFKTQLDDALTNAPTSIVSLYLGQQRPPQYQYMIQPAIDRAEKAGAHWLVSRQLLHAVGLAIRTELIPDMLTLLDGEIPTDEAIGNWANKHFYRIAYSYPSLVDHADGETLIQHPDGQHRPPGRIAWKTGTRPQWTRNYVEMN